MNSFYLLVLAGLIIRLTLIPIPGFKFDIDAWFSWALRLNELGFSHFYSPDIWTNYTPGYLYVLGFLGFIKNLFDISTESFYYVLKLPAILAELAIGIFIYKLALQRLSNKIASLSAALVLLNPVLIFNSAVWGQIDGILTLLLILTVYYLNRKSLILSSIFFGLSILIKPQALAIAPIFPLFIFNHFSLKNILKLTFPGLSVILLFSFPFFITQPISGFFQLLSKMIGDYPYISLNAYNTWGIIGFWINDNLKVGILTYQQIGYVFYFLYWVLLAYSFISKKISLYALATLATMAFFFLPTRVHERYLYPSIPFLIILFIFFRSRFILILTSLLSLVHFINLYFVYIYYNVLYLKTPSSIYLPNLYYFIEQNSRFLSVASTLLFLILTIFILRLEYARKNTYS